MTLGERLIELSYHDFQIKFEKLNGAPRGSKCIVGMRISRGRHCRYFVINPCEFQCVFESSEVNGVLMKEINRCVCDIIDAENKDLTKMLAEEGDEDVPGKH